eukprot:TRINITY_DN21476_c0_g6_i1.p1 TRINITY_DN21476_c0_g6~~TRINITY_DN21476_c0_g6_i1.p1  ORF type:complete len:760 (+),score=77.49 TRINITY_DN21476_c0_g6_i1:51-2282(+)
MVGPVDLLTVIATFGTSIQSFFTWAAYNRDNFGYNIGWRQNQNYQNKNYYSLWVSFARDDLLDMKSVSVHHTSNYMMVSTLMLSSTVLAFAVAGFSPSCPTFVVFAFYTSGATAVIFLMLAIMFGVKSQASAYENTVSMLTKKLRPYAPDPKVHDYMAQAQHIEGGGMSSLCRQPGAEENYGVTVEGTSDTFKSQHPQRSKPKSVTDASNLVIDIDACDQAPAKPSVVGREASVDAGAEVADERKDDGTFPFEMVNMKQDAHYLSTFHELMHLWKPHEDSCKVCMGLGTVSFAQSAAYFTIGKIVGYSEHYLEELLSLTVTVAFVFMMVAILSGYRGSCALRACLIIIVVSSHVFSAVASVTTNRVTLAIFVPLAFFLYFVFWLTVMWAVLRNRGQPSALLEAAQNSCGLKGEQAQADPHRVAGQVRSAEAVAPGIWLSNARAPGAKESADDAGTHEYFSPADLVNFRIRAVKKHLASHKMLLQAAGVCCAMWLCLTGWAIAQQAVVPWQKGDLVSPKQMVEANVESIGVKWPSPLYHPRSVACAGSEVFTADRYQIYKVFPKGDTAAIRVPCDGLSGTIQALSATCNEHGCHPLALVHGAKGAYVVNCSSSVPLVGDARAAQHLAMVHGATSAEPKLLVTHGSELVQYKEGQSVWRSEWSLGQLSNSERLRDVASSSNATMFFYSAPGKRATIEVMSMRDQEQVSRWTVPRDVLSGCATGHRSAMLLIDEANRPALVQATLL